MTRPKCSECGAPFSPNDRVYLVDNELLCRECFESNADELFSELGTDAKAEALGVKSDYADAFFDEGVFYG